eukprot:2497357-Amphidinium_carterae.1
MFLDRERPRFVPEPAMAGSGTTEGASGYLDVKQGYAEITLKRYGPNVSGLLPTINQPHGDGEDQIVWDEEHLVVVGAPCRS